MIFKVFFKISVKVSLVAHVVTQTSARARKSVDSSESVFRVEPNKLTLFQWGSQMIITATTARSHKQREKVFHTTVTFEVWSPKLSCSEIFSSSCLWIFSELNCRFCGKGSNFQKKRTIYFYWHMFNAVTKLLLWSCSCFTIKANTCIISWKAFIVKQKAVVKCSACISSLTGQMLSIRAKLHRIVCRHDASFPENSCVSELVVDRWCFGSPMPM